MVGSLLTPLMIPLNRVRTSLGCATLMDGGDKGEAWTVLDWMCTRIGAFHLDKQHSTLSSQSQSLESSSVPLAVNLSAGFVSDRKKQMRLSSHSTIVLGWGPDFVSQGPSH